MQASTVCAIVRMAGLALIVWSFLGAADYVSANLMARDTTAALHDAFAKQSGSGGAGLDFSAIMQGLTQFARWRFLDIVVRLIGGFVLLLIAPAFARYAVHAADHRPA